MCARSPKVTCTPAAASPRIHNRNPQGSESASKLTVLVNFLQAFFAVVLGNVAYFLLAPSLPIPLHRPFQFDWGLVVDFWFCVVAYGLIRTARKWK